MKLDAYVINLNHRPERWQHAQVWEQWFTLHRHPATRIPHRGATSCKLSHKNAAEEHLKDWVIILEDDAEPTEWFRRIGMKCIEEAIRHVDQWDYVNLGPFLDFRSWKHSREPNIVQTCSPLFLHPDYSQQTHFVMYNQKTIPLLEKALSLKEPLDNCLGDLSTSQWVPVRLLARQAKLGSDITPGNVNLDVYYDLSEKMLAEISPTTPTV